MKKRTTFKVAFLLLLAVILTQCTKSKNDVLSEENDSSPQNKIKTEAVAQTNIFPDTEWKDINGNRINAHSAGIYYENGFYHWYGEHKLPGFAESTSKADGGIHLYRSRDLINWNDFGVVMSVDYNNANSDIAYGCRIQRPKVVYNSSTGKYVAIFKLFLKGGGVTVGYNGVATATSATGPFTYQGKFLAASFVNGSGDFALYKATNGDLYHFTVNKANRIFCKAKMSADYLTPATGYTACPGVATNTEGPALFYKDGTYHLLGSGSTGWDPNAPRYYTSSSIDGPWTVQANPLTGTNSVTGVGPSLTYGGQPTYIQKIEGVENQYIAMFDVWKPLAPTTSRYIWLPFRVSNQKLGIKWVSSWNLTWFNNN